MEKKYKNAPVVEALCEFQFIPNQPWDITIPGLIYEKIRKVFPEKQQQIGIGVQFRTTEKGIEHKVEPAPPRIQFYKNDKTALIQVAPDLLVVNQLKPYPAWENFKSIILENFQVYKEVANPKGFKRIGLRYINVLEFDKLQVELTDYFRYYPFIPENLPKIHGSFLTRVEFPFEDDNEMLILTFGSKIPSKLNIISLVLDIDYAMIKPEYIFLDAIENWLDKAHERVENAFEASITDKARNLFEKEEK
jgi:uncharacterized protein (TIGR04255 family)